MATPVQLTPPAHAVVPQRHPTAPRPGTVLDPHAVGCYACDPARDGLRVQITVGNEMDVIGHFVVERKHEGSPGIAHGGLLATAVDETMSGLFTLLRTKMVTGSLQVTYRLPVTVGAEVYLPVRMDAQAGRQYFASGEGRLGSVDGPVALEAHAVFFAIDNQYFGEIAPAEGLASFNPEMRN